MRSARELVVAGVDGRRGGWAVALVRVSQAGRSAGSVLAVDWRVVPGQDAAGVREVLALADAAGAAAIGVDAPMGLPEHSWRHCDLAARRLLGRASARVFLAPPRAVLAAPSYAEARSVARELLGGRSVSAQTYGLRGVITALDQVLRDDPTLTARVIEVHPELSFMRMAGRGPGDPLPSKRMPEGRAARLAALAGWAGPEVDPADLDPPSGDDHLDAMAAAWSAWRWSRGSAEQLGTQIDAAGLPARIVI